MHYRLFSTHPQYLVFDKTLRLRAVVSTAPEMAAEVRKIAMDPSPKATCAPTPSNLGVGGLTVNLGETPNTLSGSTWKAKCEDGYVASGDIMCEDGTFLAHTAKCTEAPPCVDGTLSNLGATGLKLKLGAPRTPAGASAVAACETGYVKSVLESVYTCKSVKRFI